MNFRSFFSGAILAASAALIPWQAHAATISDCVATAVPEKDRKEIVRHYMESGLDGLKAVSLEEVAVSVGMQCISLGQGDEERRINQFGSALAGYTMRLGAEAALAQRHSLDDAELQSAWAALTQPQRSSFTMFEEAAPVPMDAVVAFIHAASPNIPEKALEQLRADDELKAEFKAYEPLVKDLTAYAIGRGAMEAAAR